MKFLCGTYWGSHPDTLLILYKSYIRSIMDYGSFIYLPKNKQDKLKLERIQFAAIRCALGYRMSTPTNILLAEAKMFSFEERTKMLGKAYIAKALSNTETDASLGHEIKNSPDPDRALCERLEAEQTLPVYTDGSKIKEAASVGYGIFCPATGHRGAGSLSPQCSIFTARVLRN
ncbi:unnamed protein product [Trichogramma brassicae]|uniref:RNase H type-1 domain-containing protein n=1 Tax=Trichogramma brassicae TaxID=86971 RepID=A0A6H5IV74_9HYME|nr:unnamed protein product [Trichogramma brassicae]